MAPAYDNDVKLAIPRFHAGSQLFPYAEARKKLVKDILDSDLPYQVFKRKARPSQFLGENLDRRLFSKDGIKGVLRLLDCESLPFIGGHERASV